MADPGTLTLDINSDRYLSSCRGREVENPAGVGTSGVAILRDDWEHADSRLPLPVLHQCLQSGAREEK